MAQTVVPTYCALCISRCGCLATVEDGRLLRIDADPDHPMHCTATFNPKLTAGTVWAHYGWWHAGEPIDYNACMDGERFDAISGSNALRGIACDVRRKN